jgi:branched-chain amino acid transport system ATP-binding protein
MIDASTSTAPALATYGLCLNFGGLAAVRDVTIALRQGELHAVIGPNGAGKSTLVNLLSGELCPTAGRIELKGREVTGEPPWRMTRLGIARSFQRTNIFKSLSVLENVRLAAQAVMTSVGRLLRPADGEAILIDRARAALARSGLAGAGRRLAGNLSHGEQRQLEIALTLASGAMILLLDEPLAGMGFEESDRMMRLLTDLAADHAILLIEHDMDFVFAVADRMTVMVDGSIIAHGKPVEIRANAAVQRAYLGGDI